MTASSVSPGKRPRSPSRSPHERPAKRRAASPEEGELDEPAGRPPPERVELPPASVPGSLPPKPRTGKPMPFKTKPKGDGDRRDALPRGDRYIPAPQDMGWMPPPYAASPQHHQQRHQPQQQRPYDQHGHHHGGRGSRERRPVSGMDSYRPSEDNGYGHRDDRDRGWDRGGYYSPRRDSGHSPVPDYRGARRRSQSPPARHGRQQDSGWSRRASHQPAAAESLRSPAAPMAVDEPVGPPPLMPPPPSGPAPPLPSPRRRPPPPPDDSSLMPPPPPPLPPGAPSAHHTPMSVMPAVDKPQPTSQGDPRTNQPPRSPPKDTSTKPNQGMRRRSPEEEKAFYGRNFTGCGKLNDYDLILKVGEGTFGEVHKAMHKDNLQTVALKRIFMHNESEGVPVTALREIRILKMLKHENILPLYDMIITRQPPKDGEKPKGPDMYMIFPYMDYDLAGLLENKEVKLTPSIIKMFMQQLCRGTEYLHRNNILHRDMKAANLLIAKSGQLIIADFGLARPCDAPDLPSDQRNYGTRFTNMVVTRWYRPPELLLGARHYGGAVDMWGVGCIFAEMFTRSPILRGNTDGHQFELIVDLCGTPNDENWPACPAFDPTITPQEDVRPRHDWVSRARRVDERFRDIITDVLARRLLDEMLALDPAKRLTATAALDHDYFYANPPPMELGKFPQWAPSHEYDKRRNAAPVQHVQPPNAPVIPPYMAGPIPARSMNGHQPPRGQRHGAPPNQQRNGRPPAAWGGQGQQQQQQHWRDPSHDSRGRGAPGPPSQQFNGPPHGRGYPPGASRGGGPPFGGPGGHQQQHPRPEGLPKPITLARNDAERRRSGPPSRSGGPGGNVQLNYQ